MVSRSRSSRRSSTRIRAPAGLGRVVRAPRDDQLALDEVLDLAFTGPINANKVVNAVLPGGVGMVGTTSVVTLNQETLDAISKDLADDGILKKANVPPSPNESLLGG